MNSTIIKAGLLLPTLSLIAACTWVELTEQGKQVSIVSTNDVVSCKKVGNISATTRQHLVVGSDRERKKVAKELANLARNEAVNLNANRIVAENEPTNGKQQFSAYHCPI